MENYFQIQFALFALGAVFLVVFSFYIEYLDGKMDKRKDKYLSIFKTTLVIYTVWFVFSGFYTTFFIVYPIN